MLRENFKLAFRNLQKNKISSFINISGLTVGTAVAILTGLWVYDEISFNTYHDNYDRIAKVAIKGVDPRSQTHFLSSTLSYPLTFELMEKYREDFKRVVRSAAIGPEILTA